MKKLRIVIALGGNAILSKEASAQAQQETLRQTAKQLVRLVKAGHDIVITHGNGPQVGNLLLQQLAADSPANPALPLDTLVAMTEGSISYWLQNALNNELQRQGLTKEVAAIVTEVIVDPDDPAFSNPSKPIGPFLSEEEARIQTQISGGHFREDSGRGWRKVVPSPKPLAIKEIQIIKTLIASGALVITAGGGGLPVIHDRETGDLIGAEAVIDKDLASQVLAQDIQADLFIMLTGVDYVYIDFNKSSQQKLTAVNTSELREYIKQNQFAPGSMLPKIEAALNFLDKLPQAKVIITSLDKLAFIFEGAGTHIRSDSTD